MWEQCSARCLPVLADAAIKGTVVLVLAWLLVLCMRRKSAALRHAVWLVAMVCLLVLLLLSAITPR
jgi:beta-lactamase regulating signal transducer with metallopeptidase domain